MIRSGSREQKKKTLPGGSGSGDLDYATEPLMGLPTVLYPDPMTTTAAAATTNAGSACYIITLDNTCTHTHFGIYITI